MSADLDREATAAESRAADAHRQRCAPCRYWADRAAAVTRRARMCAADAGPDFVEGLVQLVADER